MEALATAGKALLKMVAVDTVADREKRNRIFIAVGSIIAALVSVILLPLAVLFVIVNSEPPTLDKAAFLSQLTPEQQSQLADMEADGQAIAEALAEAGLQEQTIKAQLIYLSCFDGERLTDFAAYAEHFAQDDEQLIQSLNADYGLEIDYDEFIQAYTLITNDKGE
ncbi:MAG: hypothetical protein IKW90_16840 [Lachnospiraceae bacterium]|nr:hypothetical protein [Lachnospiraceae bacterium]